MDWRRRLAAARPHLRVAFLAFHLVAITVASLPSPLGMMRRDDWARPQVTAEFDAWAQRLSRLGMDPVELKATTWEVARRWAAVHAALRRPFLPYYACCGTIQAWRLFGAPDRFPSRLWIDVRIDGAWIPVYREHSAAHRWMRGALSHHRMRALAHVYADAGRPGDLDRLGRWLGDVATRDFPDATQIRLRWMRARLPTPDELRAGQRPPLHLAAELTRRIGR